MRPRCRVAARLDVKAAPWHAAAIRGFSPSCAACACSTTRRMAPHTTTFLPRAPQLRASLRAALAGAFLVLTLVGCDDDGPGGCRGGTCTCFAGEACDVPCDEPPCTLVCEGNNPDCRGECANGDCLCGAGSSCDFACTAPPCHADCGQNSSCGAECANGDCSCGPGASCTFSCNASPCHVACEQNSTCNAECANGSCVCAAGASCTFTCLDHDCTAECGQNASCSLTCENAPNTQGCSFNSCTGTPTVCPDGKTVVCNTSCPTG